MNLTKVIVGIGFFGFLLLALVAAGRRKPQPTWVSSEPYFKVMAPPACAPILEKYFGAQKAVHFNADMAFRFEQDLNECGGKLIDQKTGKFKS